MTDKKIVLPVVEECENCRYWNEVYDGINQHLGDCRRRAPVLIMSSTPLVVKKWLVPRGSEDVDEETVNNADHALWPVTGCCDWCGDWGPKKEISPPPPHG